MNSSLRWLGLWMMAFYGSFLVTIAGSWFFHVALQMPRTDPNADKLIFTICFFGVFLGGNLMVYALFEIVHPKTEHFGFHDPTPVQVLRMKQNVFKEIEAYERQKKMWRAIAIILLLVVPIATVIISKLLRRQ